MNRKPFVTGEYYHIYNRGVDRREVFLEEYDIKRFIRSIKIFNRKTPIKSLHNFFLQKNKFRGETPKSEKIVEILCYCLIPNHFHFILKQLVDGGISEFMKRLGGGYTCYFNEKYKRNGSLFQGTFKSIHIDSNEYLLHLNAYINLNFLVHGLGNGISKLVQSSWGEYIGDEIKNILCVKNIVLNQFKNVESYKSFAQNTVTEITKRRKDEKDTEKILLE